MSSALCLLCGRFKEAVEAQCGDCGHSPREDEMELARLFSSAHLSLEEMQEAQARIETGERPAPKSRPPELALEQGLQTREKIGLVLGAVLLTPLLGFTFWWGWRGPRPRAARQALVLTGAVALVLALFWAFLMWA